MTTGEIIKALRTERGLTQGQLAKEVGLSKSAIIKYENNERKPDFEAIAKLEEFFNVSASYLLGKTIYRNISEKVFFTEVLHLDETLRDKPEEIRKAAISIYNSFKEIVEKIIEQNEHDAMKRLSILRSLTDKINTIYFSDYLPTKELWEEGKLSELEFYKKKEAILKKHLSAVEHYLYEAFTMRCNELYEEYQATFDTIDKSKIYSIDKISHEIAADSAYIYPQYFKKSDDDKK